MKVLVTGSREWTNEEIIRRELSALPDGTVVVHGHCPYGADAIADRVATELGFEVRRYPARWTARSGGHAGNARNQRMIDAEHFAPEPIYLCLAFPKNTIQHGGTMDCVVRAREAGIEVKILEQVKLSQEERQRRVDEAIRRVMVENHDLLAELAKR